MSGDVQPRKRKDKKRKKDEVGSSVSEDIPTLFSAEETFHVHKDGGGTGGNFLAKIVFFVLMAALVVMIGLVITEYRGSTDVDTPVSESRWASFLDGWVDDSIGKHDDHDEPAASEEDEDHGDEHGEQEHSAEEKQEVDEHDEHEEEEEEEEAEPEDEAELSTEEIEPSQEEEEEDDEPEEVVQQESEEQIEAGEEEDEVEEDEQQSEEVEETNEEQSEEENVEEEEEEEQQQEEPASEEVASSTASQEEEEEEDGDEGSEEQLELEIPGITESKEIVDDDDEDEGIGSDEEIDEGEIDGVEEVEEVEEDAENEIAQNQLVDDIADEEEDEEDIVPENEGLMSSGKQSEEEAKPPTPPPTKASPQVKTKPASGGRSAEEDDEKAQYGDDWDIKAILDDADAQIDQNPKAALIAYSVLLEKYNKSPRGWLGKAKVLDRLAEIRHSNTLLTHAIETYQNFLMLPNVPDNLWVEAALRCIDRMRFRGQHNKALAIHEELVKKFPDDFNYSNQMAVTLLILNRVAEAKVVLENVLKKWPNNGFAQVHYGFILKTSENKLEEAVKYLNKGIKSGENGTIDGRFFFQLGDSLTRLGRSEEAYNIYKLGVKENLFLSVYQRSLYNINRLTGKPWWEIQDTPYLIHFDILKRNWKTIRDEALAVLRPDRQSAFKDETENLKDTGDWKQLEFFARGHRSDANCKLAPVTCALLDQFPAARNCLRGQSKFSVMTGGTHVWPHCGPTNCRLRAHLGLKVPPGTSIRVANETRTWREGEIIIFDDSFEHEVWHNGTESRIVLIVDVWHPELTDNERLTLPAI